MSQITSDTEICNLALQRIGETTITSLGQGTEVARRCKIAYPQARDAMLRGHFWNFAVKRSTLALSTETPDWEYTYKHVLPDDFLRLVRTNIDTPSASANNEFHDGQPDYRLESGFIVSNDATVKIEYVFRQEDISKYDDLFIDALIARMSAELAAASKKSMTGVQGLWEVAERKLREARTADSQEGVPRSFEASIWVNSRL